MGNDASVSKRMTINTRANFDRFVQETIASLEVPVEYRSYYAQHTDRLWLTTDKFGLLHEKFQHVLEIGPGFSFTPFLWKAFISDQVSIFEGESFELLEFASSYLRFDIRAHYGDLFQIFGGRDPLRNRLPFDSDQFDCIICWETMEHFNFNPIPFLNEVRRIMSPGGVLYLTVPNQAKLDQRLRLLVGATVRTPVETYFLQMDDRNRMKYAPHWREYTLVELVELLQRLQFRVTGARYLQVFQNRNRVSLALAAKRTLATIATRVFPSFSALCLVQARRQE